MGAGHVRPGGNGRKAARSSDPGLVYDAGLFDYAAFTCGMKWEVFTPSSCDLLDSLGVPSAPTDLNVPSIGISEVAGSQTVTRTVTSVARSNAKVTYRARVSAPAGFKVKVSPSKITLRRGQSATFTVTVTNVSAPIDAWRFGSLTWVSHDYKVRSPIAVKGALFDAPEEVAGTGTAGSVSIPVEFGYTGAYTAAAHGLVKATLTHAKVKQDADQTFAPGDVATGGAISTSSRCRTRRCSGSPSRRKAPRRTPTSMSTSCRSARRGVQQHGRWHRRAGRYPLPANGVWKVYVHGWSTPGRRLRLRHVVMGDPRDARRRLAVDHVGAGVGDDRHGGHGRSDLGGHHGRNGRGLVPGRGVTHAARPA